VTGQFTLSPAVAQRLQGNLPLAIFGLTLIVVMIAAPGGLQGLIRRGARALARVGHGFLTRLPGRKVGT